MAGLALQLLISVMCTGFLASVPGFVVGSHTAYWRPARVWLKLAADHHCHHKGLKMGSNAKYSPIIITPAHADIIKFDSDFGLCSNSDNVV